jgi:hypothetical protein
LKIILTVFTGGSKYVIIHEWSGDYGWPGVELEPVDLKNTAAAPQPVALFEYFNVVAVDSQPACRSQPPKTTPDYDDFLLNRFLVSVPGFLYL